MTLEIIYRVSQIVQESESLPFINAESTNNKNLVKSQSNRSRNVTLEP